jgi:hypothetical protein
LNNLLARVTELSPHELVGALRCGAAITRKSAEHTALLIAGRKHLLAHHPKEQVDSWLIGLDRP